MDRFSYIRDTYGVDPRLGQRVRVNGKLGVVKKGMGNYVGVLFDGSKKVVPCHPTWEFEYDVVVA